MSRKKSSFATATSSDRPELGLDAVLAASQEANLLAAELLTEAQMLRKAGEQSRGQLSKSTTMRMRGLAELLAGEVSDEPKVPAFAEALALLSSTRALVFRRSLGGKPHEQDQRDAERLLPQIEAMLALYPDPESRLVDDGRACESYFEALADEQELRRQLRRAQELRDQSVAVCERRTEERDRCRALNRKLTDEAGLGRALQDLVDQVTRLHRTPCQTMGFGFGPFELTVALASEAYPGSDRARAEVRDILTLGVHIAIANDQPMLEGLHAAARKLRRRLDFIDAGGTWAQAKDFEAQLPVVAYTIGRRTSYDQALAEVAADGRCMRKVGKGDQGRDPDYPGGWVSADLHGALAKAQAWSEEHGREFAVYALELPQPWELCTYAGKDGEHHLLVDAIITGRVDPHA